MPNPVTLFAWLLFGQGILLSVAILTRRKFRSNSYLGVFIILLSIHGLSGIPMQNPDGTGSPELIVLLSCLPFLYGPLIYRYVWHIVYSDFSDPVPFVVHAVPAIITFILYSAFYLFLGRDNFAVITQEVLAGRPPWYVKIIESLKILQGIFYCALITLIFLRHKSGLRKFASEKQRRLWLISMITVFSLNWLLVLISTALLWNQGPRSDLGSFLTGAQLIAFLLFIYVVTVFSLRYPFILEPKEVREEIRKKLNLPDGFIEETLIRLKRAETEGFYTDPEITLGSLAEKIGLHPNALSFIINEKEGFGFREYLNRLRLEHFLQKASQSGNSRNRLETAFDSGFSSKTTFLRAFRKQFGTTPGEYLEKAGTDSHTEGINTHTGTPDK